MPQAYGPFTLTQGEALSFDVTSNIPISIYIMTANDYQAWANGSTCAAGSSVLYSRQQVSSDYIDMIAPSSGDYYLVLLNLSPTRSASVNVGYTDIYQAVTTVPVPAVTEFATTETQTATSRLTEVQPVTEPLQQYGLYAIILVLVLALGLLALRRRSSKKTVGTATVAAKQAAPISGKFCGDCGKPISMEAKFCPNAALARRKVDVIRTTSIASAAVRLASQGGASSFSLHFNSLSLLKSPVLRMK